jgi:hypothetical protein
MNTIENAFQLAATGGNIIELIDGNGRRRIVEPYMIYTTGKGKRCFHCYQLDGFSESGNSIGWKNPEIESFRNATILDGAFAIRREYNPGNSKMFPDIHFRI